MNQFLCGIHSNQLKFTCSLRNLRRTVSKLEVKFLSFTYYHTFCCRAHFHCEKHITFPWRQNRETFQTLGLFPGLHGVLVLFYPNLIIYVHKQILEMARRNLKLLQHQHTCSSKDKHEAALLSASLEILISTREDTSWISSQNDEKPVLPD